jgi:biotin operon repressor
MLPTAIFEAGRQFKWKARFILGLGYLYALCYNGNKAVTTVSELKQILSTKSVSRIYELLDIIETFNRSIFIEAGKTYTGNFINFTRGKYGKTEFTLVMPQELYYLYENNRFFPVPKISFLLPVSAQAKAIFIFLHYLKNKGSNFVSVGVRKLAEELTIDKVKVKNYVDELREIGVLAIQKEPKKRTSYIIRSPENWSKELILSLFHQYSLLSIKDVLKEGKIPEGYKKYVHPFLREWKLDVKESYYRNKYPHRKSYERKKVSSKQGSDILYH